MKDEYVVKQAQVGKYYVKVMHDNYAESPRSWDNLGTMICFHNRHNLGDKHNMEQEELLELVKRKDVFSLPLFLYDHSGITISCHSFNDKWDSGKIGYIYVSKETIKKEFSNKKFTKKFKKQIYSILESEVNTYDKYLTGEVYGYVVKNETGDETDSCWGYYDSKECLIEGIDIVKYRIKKDIHDHIQKVKTWIKNQVPLDARYACPIQN
jgi:hypothetical protein